MGLESDIIVEGFLDSLPVELLEAAVARNKGVKAAMPKPMTDDEELGEYYRRLIISRGILFPKSS
ncbi:hypothetical protein [Maribacter forsetii]|uniref:hypothetical protein n=1 Tax=Maribacter forsetii TaxID=444515 RepID=UPI0005697582|nr:hypothetical protein [Maribacter forsetii]